MSGGGVLSGIGGSPVGSQRRRFGEPAKFVPVLFVVVTITLLYCIYVFVHCRRMLQIGVPEPEVDRRMRYWAVVQLLIFHYITALLLVCYVRSILSSPGEIPDNDPQWEYIPQDGRSTDGVSLNMQETKRSGDRRHCKWCGKYKPDRCHHCRVCRTCILKMDHHCPWIYNCVGHANYKYFFLLLFYCVLDLHFMLWTMAPSVLRLVQHDTRFLVMFLILFGETLTLFLGALVSVFFGFHVWLMFKAMTTIEFCEKSLPKKGRTSTDKPAYDSSAYDMGLIGNTKTILGNNFFLAFFPVHPSPGDGLNFVSEETRLTKDLEASKSIRRKTHQRTQRKPRGGGATPRFPTYGAGGYMLPEDALYSSNDVFDPGYAPR